jgi:cobalt/nickel transport system permease protein
MNPLLAVHLSDGTVLWPWQAGGYVLAALLALWGAWRIADEEIPRVALLTSAFFVVSLIHLRVGPTSVHLLLNGLLGVILGRRVCLAIPIGLFLQAVFGHGGFGTLGLNTCIFVLPALGSALVFSFGERALYHSGIHSPDRLGLLGAGLGALTAVNTVFLNCLVLYFGGQEDWPTLVGLVFVAHLPVMVIEGIVLGSTVAYVARVKPELFIPARETLECAVESAP